MTRLLFRARLLLSNYGKDIVIFSIISFVILAVGNSVVRGLYLMTLGVIFIIVLYYRLKPKIIASRITNRIIYYKEINNVEGIVGIFENLLDNNKVLHEHLMLYVIDILGEYPNNPKAVDVLERASYNNLSKKVPCRALTTYAVINIGDPIKLIKIVERLLTGFRLTGKDEYFYALSKIYEMHEELVLNIIRQQPSKEIFSDNLKRVIKLNAGLSLIWELYNCKSWAERFDVVLGLREILDPKIVRELLRIMKQDFSYRASEATYNYIGLIHEELKNYFIKLGDSAVEVLIDNLEDHLIGRDAGRWLSDLVEAGISVEAIMKITDYKLLSSVLDRLSIKAFSSLVFPKSVIDIFILALHDQESFYKEMAVRVLGSTGDPSLTGR
jgi:hypothetical protein